jgi:hypothetical protein
MTAFLMRLSPLQNIKKKIMKVSVLCSVLLLALVSNSVFAQVVRLDVTVNPSTIKVNEFADVTIRAIDSAGNVVTTYGNNNDGDILMYIEEYGSNAMNNPDFILPWSGFYFFEAADQWARVFSKGLTVLTPGTYTLKVSELFNTAIKWEARFTVVWTWTLPQQSNVIVTSPTSGSTITTDTLNVIGTTQLPNTPIAFYIDAIKVQDSLSDQNANFNIFITWVQPWNHRLEVRAMDLAQTQVGTSWPIPFTYAAQNTNTSLLLGVEVQPSNQVAQNAAVTIIVTTDPSVTAATLQIASWPQLPTERQMPGRFVRQVTMNEIWSFPVHVILTAPQVTREFRDQERITVSASERRILTLNATVPLERNRNAIDLMWTYTGVINNFRVMYGLNPADMAQMITVTTPQTTLTRQDTSQTWFIQVWPVDSDNNVIWLPSPITSVPWLPPVNTDALLEIKPAPTPKNACNTGNIPLRTTIMNERYYLAWDPVPGAIGYMIYRAEQQPWSIAQMMKVWETAQTMYEYMFDPNAKADKYAWYAVQARCEDWTSAIVDDIKKVKVWPMDTIIVMIMASLLVYGLSRVVKS